MNATRNMKGENGGRYINNSTPVTGDWDTIIALTNCTLTLVSANIAGTLTGITVQANGVIYGRFSSITATAGTLIAYNTV